MKKVLLVVLANVIAMVSGVALAQGARASKLVQYHSTVGTTTAAAITAASTDLIGWKICNDAINTSTYLLVGTTADAATDGTMLAPGACYACEQCTTAMLNGMKVKGQAASNGYSVIQYKR